MTATVQFIDGLNEEISGIKLRNRRNSQTQIVVLSEPSRSLAGGILPVCNSLIGLTMVLGDLMSIRKHLV